MASSRDFLMRVASASNEFELANSQLKIDYFIQQNYIAFATMLKKMAQVEGSFGTGYPFYFLDNKFKGELPVVAEQLRYNNQLIHDVANMTSSEWPCVECLDRNMATRLNIG